MVTQRPNRGIITIGMNIPPDLTQRLMAVSAGLARRFPDNNGPFEIMTRLLEECGELAEQVNHFEGIGVKREKHGEPELEAAIERSYQRLKAEGFIE